MARLLVAATHNRDKFKEFAAALAGLEVELRPVYELAPGFQVEETGETLEENAILKAEAACRVTGEWTFADDTGLEVKALGGRPGVYSARYAGKGASYADNRRKLLAELEGVPAKARTARFRAVIALARPGRRTRTYTGEVEGIIITEERGSNGFGYDPVFYVEALGKTFAEIPMAEKNRFSHRGRALRRLFPEVRRLLGGAARRQEKGRRAP